MASCRRHYRYRVHGIDTATGAHMKFAQVAGRAVQRRDARACHVAAAAVVLEAGSRVKCHVLRLAKEADLCHRNQKASAPMEQPPPHALPWA